MCRFVHLSQYNYVHSGAVTVASADEVTGAWSVNHVLKLSSQQVAGTQLNRMASGHSLVASNMSMQMNVILVRSSVWSGHKTTTW